MKARPRFLVIRPKHWYERINPIWWWKTRRIEKFLNHMAYEADLPTKAEKAYLDMLTYGHSTIEFNDHPRAEE